ncbi:Bromodomain [Dillenia turbinata]|uniref:Bromodomain n=1 Tax=Dillenia turbinata TaxID=194707 RepID=A0AAN8WCL8_9MAGN
MKRKRGHWKGKSKKKPVVEGGTKVETPNVTVNMEDNSGLDESDNNNESDSGIEAETPSLTEIFGANAIASKPESENANQEVQDVVVENKQVERKVYGRVRLKLKTTKVLDAQITSSDGPTQSDTDKSSQQVGMEKQAVGFERMEDSANSLQTVGSRNSSKKMASIKIKTSKSLGSSSLNHIGGYTASFQGEVIQQKEAIQQAPNPRYNKRELEDALIVIKKIMKMDAAEPFNAPVNPIELGIPDYFDIIDTPMDFGTICGNLENGVKYMNSEDVFKDVQYIWDNCYKYNNKGDYILELMKRVKKNFTKYWAAAGLYNEHMKRPNGEHAISCQDNVTGVTQEGGHVRTPEMSGRNRSSNFKEDILASSSRNGQGSILAEKLIPSSQIKTYSKGAHKPKKRKRMKRHKDDCMCAVCILKRRRREREENAQLINNQAMLVDNNEAQTLKHEEMSPAEGPSGEDTSSNVENSMEQDAEADVELEEKGDTGTTKQIFSSREEKHRKDKNIQIPKTDELESPEQSQPGDMSGEDQPTQEQVGRDSVEAIPTHSQEEETPVQHEEEAAEIQIQKQKESQEKRHKAQMYESFLRFENPMLEKLCETLFPNNSRSVWSGPHSLAYQQHPARKSSLDAAVSLFMK